jgi:D-beta-D-heptose 7-phosphate kinase/D-beta-D-heptose 1-phosphate adenosyltransferase
MTKVTTLTKVAKLARVARRDGKTIGLVTGSFDLIHLGHINLFRFAKKHTDIVIVGLDNDQTIKLVKVNNRHINDFKK